MKQTIRRFSWVSMALLLAALAPVTACSDKSDDAEADGGSSSKGGSGSQAGSSSEGGSDIAGSPAGDTERGVQR